MRKLNPIQKFFQDYPIIWIMIVIIATGWLVTYLLTNESSFLKRKHEKPKQHKSDVIRKPKAKAPKVEVPPVNAPVASAIQPGQSPVPVENEAQMMNPIPVQPALPVGQTEMKTSEALPLPQLPNPVVQKVQIAFIIDDLGYNKNQAELLFSIDRPLTIAILPQLKYSEYFAEEGKKQGFDTLLHQPLEPENKTNDPGPGLITVNMKAEEIEQILEKNLLTVPNVIGMNNHMGSQATRDRRVMYVIAKKLKEKNLFFLDSMTHSQSIAYNVAFALGIPSAKRDVFLDNEDNYDKIIERIKETESVAKEHGRALAIGHIRQKTLQAIKDSIPKLEADGVEIISFSGFIKNSGELVAPSEAAVAVNPKAAESQAAPSPSIHTGR